MYQPLLWYSKLHFKVLYSLEASFTAWKHSVIYWSGIFDDNTDLSEKKVS